MLIPMIRCWQISLRQNPPVGEFQLKRMLVVIGCKGHVAQNALLTLLQVQEFIGKLLRICETKSTVMMRNLSIQL